MRVIETGDAPKAIGPYAQAIDVGEFIFCSGQVPLHPGTGEMVGQDIETQTDQVMKNVTGLVRSQGLALTNIVKTTVFMKNLGDFPRMNAIYERHFGSHRPARSTVEVSRLPKDALVEIECIVKK